MVFLISDLELPAMMSPENSAETGLRKVGLNDKYTRQRGSIYISGTQALARLPLLQQQRDRAAGLNTAGYISGYRGSPLGGFDLALGKMTQQLANHDIIFQPGVNEELAADAVWGTQQLGLFPNAQRDGVFGIWYGKGPGVDRASDALKHANLAGTSAQGGVLMLAGDDHACKSSTTPHQSEPLLVACGIPVLYPSDIQEFLDYGAHGFAMSRYSGLWVSMKCVTDVVESSASIDFDSEKLQIVVPEKFAMPEGGLNIRWPDSPLDQEARMVDYRWNAALAYVRANKLNRVVIDAPQARFGIVAAGKAYLDVRQALADLGLDEAMCHTVGIRLFKVGCVWPFDEQAAREFAAGLDEILVVEEKRPLLESALKEALYNWQGNKAPCIVGKFSESAQPQLSAAPLLPTALELSPAVIAKTIAARLSKIEIPAPARGSIAARLEVLATKEDAAARRETVSAREPWFCPGCPHNTSTKVPEGSRALAGIGCHFLVQSMNRQTETFTQMGGEGSSWLGQMHFSADSHVFANLGDGTYFHSGLLAIRAAIAAKANITYRILYNDAVAMTGGQAIDGSMTVAQIAQQLTGEGASRIVVVSDEPSQFKPASGGLPATVTVHHRDQLDAIQLELRDTLGTTVIIYEQTCATEKRRRRKRGTLENPLRRLLINDAVCEGCGDCSVVSNCLAVEPLETALGVKRQINQSACNKDFSCLKGFCPSFISVEGAQLKKSENEHTAELDVERIPAPTLPSLDTPFKIVVAGIGGTGVVTIGALLGMAAHLESKGVSVFDMTGLAQKGGTVFSHIQIAHSATQIYASRISVGGADLLIGCDEVVSASTEVLSRLYKGKTSAVVNNASTPTADFIRNADWQYPQVSAENDIQASIGGACNFFNANEMALKLLGDTIYANPLLLGYAWQCGHIPLSCEAIFKAIELNGVSVDKNKRAFERGRIAAYDATLLQETQLSNAVEPVRLVTFEKLDDIINARQQLLTDYQNAAYAKTYQRAVNKIRQIEQPLLKSSGRLELTEAVARNLAKLMAYKDEYEVARLYTAPAFLTKLREQFEGEPGKDYAFNFHLAPPLLSRRDADGHLIKRNYGGWMMQAFKFLARMKWLRGTFLDPFGKTKERKMERKFVQDYLQLIDEFCESLDAARLPLAIELAKLPEQVRGFGHIKERNMNSAIKTQAELMVAYQAITPC